MLCDWLLVGCLQETIGLHVVYKQDFRQKTIRSIIKGAY